MKKTFVQIKDIAWYETNKDANGIVYLTPNDDSNFLSRGQAKYLGQLSEVHDIDAFNNYKLIVDNGEWLWKEWQFSIIEEKDITDEIIDAVFTDGAMEEIIDNVSYPVEERIDKISSDKMDKQSSEFKMKLINEINSWNLSFNLGMVAMNIISADKANIENYKNLIDISILCLQNEIKDLEKD